MVWITTLLRWMKYSPSCLCADGMDMCSNLSQWTFEGLKTYIQEAWDYAKEKFKKRK